MLAQTRIILPDARVVDQDRVLDPVFAVVEACGIRGIDELDAVAVGACAYILRHIRKVPFKRRYLYGGRAPWDPDAPKQLWSRAWGPKCS